MYIGKYIFWWHMFFNNSFGIASYGARINFFFWTFFSFFFLRTFLLSDSISLCFDPWIFYNLLIANLFPNFSLLIVFFWMLWMLVTVNDLCYVPHVSRITWETNFTEIFFGVSKKWARSWSYASLITSLKTLTKKLLTVCLENWKRMKKKKKKNRMAVSKLLSLNSNTMKWSILFFRQS